MVKAENVFESRALVRYLFKKLCKSYLQFFKNIKIVLVVIKFVFYKYDKSQHEIPFIAGYIRTTKSDKVLYLKNTWTYPNFVIFCIAQNTKNLKFIHHTLLENH